MSREVCRLCLGTDKLESVFDERMADDMNEIIYITCGVKICKTDAISQMICHSCYQIIIKMHKFRCQAIKIDQNLKAQYVKNKVSKLSTPRVKHLPAKYKHAHPSIKDIMKKYPNIKLPDNCLKSHVGAYITLVSEEVDEWYKEQEYTDEEIVEIKRKACELTNRKRENTEEVENVENPEVLEPEEDNKNDVRQSRSRKAKVFADLKIRYLPLQTKRMRISNRRSISSEGAMKITIESSESKKEEMTSSACSKANVETGETQKAEIQIPSVSTTVAVKTENSEAVKGKMSVLEIMTERFKTGKTSSVEERAEVALENDEIENVVHEKRRFSNAPEDRHQDEATNETLNVKRRRKSPVRAMDVYFEIISQSREELKKLVVTGPDDCSDETSIANLAARNQTSTNIELKSPKLQLTRVDEDSELSKKYASAFEASQEENEENTQNPMIPEDNKHKSASDVICISDEEVEPIDAGIKMNVIVKSFKVVRRVQEILGTISPDADDFEIIKRALKRQFKLKRTSCPIQSACSPSLTQFPIIGTTTHRSRIFKDLRKYLRFYKIKILMRHSDGVNVEYRTLVPPSPRSTKDLWKDMAPIGIQEPKSQQRIVGKLALSSPKPSIGPPPLAPYKEPPALTPYGDSVPGISNSDKKRTVRTLVPKTAQIKGSPSAVATSTSIPSNTPRTQIKTLSMLKTRSPFLARVLNCGNTSTPCSPVVSSAGRPSTVTTPVMMTSTLKNAITTPVLMSSAVKTPSVLTTTRTSTPVLLTSTSSAPVMLSTGRTNPISTPVLMTSTVKTPAILTSARTTVSGTPIALNSVCSDNSSQMVLNTVRSDGSNVTTFILVPNNMLPAQQGPLPVIQSVGSVIEAPFSTINTSAANTVVQTSESSGKSRLPQHCGIRVREDLKSLF